MLKFIIFCLAAAAFGYYAYINFDEAFGDDVPQNEVPEGVMCTMDAKECPDGSYVGRIGPDCRFAACPGE